MLNRKIDNEIDAHFSNSKKALFLTGARQVGKTYSIRKYAKLHGLNLIEFNFLLQPEAMDIINGAGDVKELLLRISAYSRVPLVRSKTLIFFDEVQECPDVMTWVKALVDEGSYIYALSGSLLGVELKDIRSVPVGYMSEMQVYPMDFEEFLLASNVGKDVISYLRNCFVERIPPAEGIHKTILGLFKRYLLSGGLPDSVKAFVEAKNVYEMRENQTLTYRYYSDEQLNQVINVKPKNRITIGYCRVSSHKQKDDLERQIDNVKTYLLAKGQPFEIISDIGSGINYKKKGLQELIRRISQNQVEKVVVLYKDRLLRFGFELIEYIASLYNCEIEIIDNTEKSEQQELVEDLVQIITVFSCKLQGKRANKAKKLIRELIQEETDGKSHKSNADTKQRTEN